jgi:alpha-L-rhamnosidase
MRKIAVIALFFFASMANAGVVNLRCEYQVNPLGIDVVRPHLSWELEPSASRGETQVSVQIIVASSKANLDAGTGDLWNTTIIGNKSFQVAYGGTALQSEMECWWKVKVTGSQASYDWSAPAMWSMGLLAAADWSGAKWIGDDAADNIPSPMIRNSFMLSKSIKRAMVYVTSEGAYELHLNGGKVGDQILAPGWTDYRKRILYQTYDVTSLLNAAGENVIGAIIGDGWFNAKMQGWPSRAANGSNGRKLLLKLAIENTDGTKTTVISDQNWTLWRDGPVRYADIYNGETIDSRKSYLASGGLSLQTLDNTDAAITFTAGWTNISSNLGSNWYDGTARSCNTANEYFQYTNSNCTQLKYYATKSTDEGQADVYIDNVFKQTVDLYASARTASTLLYDSGTLPQGSHTLKVVVKGTKNAASTDYWVECDRIDVMAQLGSVDIRTWDSPGFSTATGWVAPLVYTVTGPAIVAQMCEPIRVEKEITPIAMTQPQTGVYIFDMGQNMVGWCKVTLSGPAGTQVQLRHGEMLNTDGTLYTTNLRTAAQTDVFILNGTNSQVFEPHFTYHGFRYVEVTGVSGTPSTAMIVGRVFHTDAPMTGTFTCSSTLLNKIWTNTLWGQRGNHMSVPTDCPQRDERMGWMGDAQIFSQTAIFNMGMGGLYTKWLQDMRDDQTAAGAFQDVNPQFNLGMSAPAWGDAGVVIPWRLYVNYGDTGILNKHYSAAKKWVDMVHSSNTNYLWQNNRGNDYGDWLDGSAITGVSGYPAGGAIPKEVFATAFFYNSTVLLSKMAVATGNTADAQTYTTLANNIKAAFNTAYVNATTGVVNGNSQAGYALALNFGLLTDTALQAKAAKNMNDVIVTTYNTRISTGFNTTLRLMMELSNRGYNSTAYSLAESQQMPSWGYSISQGATTIWERWDGWVAGRGFQDPGMNSFNHYSFGSVCEWFYRVVLGINWDEAQPGYKHFFVKPQPGGTLTSAQGSYGSISGMISSSWKVETNGVFDLNITVPGNTTAEISIPKRNYNSNWVVRESGTLCWSNGAYVNGVSGISAGTADSNFVTFSAGSGIYSFQAGPNNLVRVRPSAKSAVNINRFLYNPATGMTTIRYSVSNESGMAAPVSIRVFDLRGIMVAEPVNARQMPGEYCVIWQAQNRAGNRLAEGTYMLRMQVGDAKGIVKKLTMMRN